MCFQVIFHSMYANTLKQIENRDYFGNHGGKYRNRETCFFEITSHVLPVCVCITMTANDIYANANRMLYIKDLKRSYGCDYCDKYDGRTRSIPCNKCHITYYCSQECMDKNLEVHKIFCQTINVRLPIRPKVYVPHVVKPKLVVDYDKNKSVVELIERSWKKIMTTKEILSIPSELWGSFSSIRIRDIVVRFCYSMRGIDFLKMSLFLLQHNGKPPIQLKFATPIVLVFHSKRHGVNSTEPLSSIDVSIEDANVILALIDAGTLPYEQKEKPAFDVRDMDVQITEKFESVRNDNDKKDGLCVICMTNRANVIVLNCFHACLCSECIESKPDTFKDCPLCRRTIVHMQKFYLS